MNPCLCIKLLKRKPVQFDLLRDAHYQISQISNGFQTKHALIPIPTPYIKKNSE